MWVYRMKKGNVFYSISVCIVDPDFSFDAKVPYEQLETPGKKE